MPIRVLRAALAIAVCVFLVVFYRIYVAMNSLAVSGSGGLGAVSGGVSELFVELAALATVVGIYLYLRSRRRRSRNY